MSVFENSEDGDTILGADFNAILNNTADSLFHYSSNTEGDETANNIGDLLDMLETSSAAIVASAQKRRRTSMGSYDTKTMLSLLEDEKETKHPSSSSMKRMEAERDEMKIKNELANDKLQEMANELEFVKGKFMRQISFLDSENSNLRKESEARLQKYYDEKKKWQTSVRELHQQHEKKESAAAKAAAAAALASTKSSSGSSKSESEESKKMTVKLKDLERLINQKSAEARINADSKIIAESKLYEAEQELKVLRSLSSSGDGGHVKSGGHDYYDRTAQEASKRKAAAAQDEKIASLTEQCSAAEDMLKRVTRAHDKLEAKVKNQTLLDVRMDDITAKLQAAQREIEKHAQINAEYDSLLKEKQTWTVQFRLCMSKSTKNDTSDTTSSLSSSSSSSSSSQESEITPYTVLVALTSLQQENATGLVARGELESKVKSLNRAIYRAETKYQESQRTRMELSSQAETATHKLHLSQQQLDLYKGEVTSLRALLQTFDAEFNIGKPTVNLVMGQKDELILRLREELDKCREMAVLMAASQITAVGGAKGIPISLEAVMEQGQGSQEHVEGLQEVPPLIPSYTTLTHSLI